MNKKLIHSIWLLAGVLCLAPFQARAQWLTQPVSLNAGWNAVYLHVDASYATIEELIGDPANPIQEVWLWAPSPSTLQFIDSPQEPVTGGSQWVSWQRAAGLSSTLTKLIPNAAYLVRLDSAVPSYTWNVKGKPVPPHYDWTTTGLNFLGFQTPPVNPPTFDTLLTAVPELKRVAEIFYYPGGDLGPSNPARVFALRTQPATRGQAYWIRSGGVFNRYFGPFEIDLPTSSGVNFQDSLSQSRILIRNLHPAPVTVSASLVPSETPPAGQTAISGLPPLLVRGPLNTTNLTYGYTNLNGTTQSWTLAAQGQPGSEVEVVFGVNRSQLTGNPGDLFAGILRFTDPLNLSQVDIPTSAQAGSTRGLWIGNVAMNQVQHYLKAYAKNSDGQVQQDSTGKYVSTNLDTSMGSVPRSFPFRLILHHDDSGKVVLLQRVYWGLRQGTNTVVSTTESVLDKDKLDRARRISSIQFPWSDANAPWIFTGELRQGASLNARVELAHNDPSSNPFLHTYHPDHDNLDALFLQPLPAGYESYMVRRDIQMNITPPASNFTSLTSGNQTLSGTYAETITFFGKGSESRQFQVQGNFVLNRMSSISTLTTQ